MTGKPQRFKILRSGDPDALALEVSAHLEGIEHVEEDGFKATYLYSLHGDTRVVSTQRKGQPGGMSYKCFRYEQNVIQFGVSATVERVKVEESASEAIQ